MQGQGSKGPVFQILPQGQTAVAPWTLLVSSVVLHCSLHSAPLWASLLANSSCFYDAACIQQVEPGMHCWCFGVWCFADVFCIAGFTVLISFTCIQFLVLTACLPPVRPNQSQVRWLGIAWPHRKHTTGRTIWQCTRLDHIVGALLGHCFLLHIANQLFDQLPLFRRLLPPWLVDGPSLAFLL